MHMDVPSCPLQKIVAVYLHVFFLLKCNQEAIAVNRNRNRENKFCQCFCFLKFKMFLV